MTAAPMPAAVAVALAALALLACFRLWRWRVRADAAGRGRRWRFAVLLAAQPLWAVLLWLALYPPAAPAPAGATLTVLTAGAAPARTGARDGPVVALPEAPVAGVPRMPDLATALRAHPQVATLRVVGAGLTARDRDAVGARGLRFDPPVPPRGLAALRWTQAPAVGEPLHVAGRAVGLAGGTAELLDPAGARVDGAKLDEDGRFRLSAPTFAEGPAAFGLRLRDAGGAEVEAAALPVRIARPPLPRLQLLAGAANAETRFLRRWATDAGLPVRTRIALGAGLSLGEAPAPSAAELARTDVLIVDARAWSGLGAGGRAAVLSAVDAGLGLVVRADRPGTLPGLWTDGFRAVGGGASVPIRLPGTRADDPGALRARLGPGSADAPFDAAQAQEPPPELARRALRVEGADAVPLGADATGAPWAWWRPHGLGRILVWTPQDSFRLALAGRADLHADLWRDAVAAVARPLPAGRVRATAPAFVDERVELCGIDADAALRVIAPDGTGSDLLVDPRAGDGCAGYWPRVPGWHRIVGGGDGNGDDNGESGGAQAAFHVFAADALPGVRAARLREATLALARPACRGDCPRGAMPASAAPVPRGPAWPWWLGWLAVATALWWFERSRLGRHVRA